MSTPAIDIRPDHWQIVRHILRLHVPQFAVWAFGSRAKWTAKPHSDLDLAIITDKPLSLSVSAALADDFSESNLPWKVDVVDWAATSESFRNVIERDKVVVQESQQNSERKWRPLQDVVDDILDRRGVTPLKLGGDFTSEGHRVISAKVVKDGRIDLNADEARFVGSDIYKKWMRSPLRADDVVMTSEAPLGELAYLAHDVDWVLGQRLFAIRPRANILSGRFLYYALSTPEVRDSLIARSSGTTVIGIRQAELRKVEVPVPPIEEQRAIAHILGALDDRIELNRRMNQTLEAMARVLFKSWFVDFDGVPPGDMQESELGLIPKGWQVASAGELYEVGIGKTPPRKEQHWFTENASDVPWVSIKDMGNSGFFVGTTSEYLTHEAVEKFNIRRVPARTVLLSFKLTVGRLAMTDTEMTTNEAIAHFKPKADSPPQSFLYCYLKQYDFTQLGSTSSIATATNSKAIRELLILLPNKEMLAQFATIANPLFERIHANDQQAATLITLRDTLLPKLISGELRVGEAEHIAETA